MCPVNFCIGLFHIIRKHSIVFNTIVNFYSVILTWLLSIRLCPVISVVCSSVFDY
jgi:hypothetical protein